MESLLNFLHNESITSPFRAELSNRGGYITFSNSGRRGDTKYFQIGIDSILSTLQDILNNIAVFSRIQDYDEKPWRDNGSIYFSDPVANANSTVQTKPLFSTLSKIIKWANQPFLNNLNTDNRISITPDTLENAITKLNAVADSFVPHSNSKTIKSQLDEPLQVIYYGAPGTGKSFTIDDITDDKNSVRTTFHPDSDYASFVGAYKPTMENVPINSIYGESVQFATGKNGHPGTEKKIVYKYVPQAFLKAYVAAWSNLNKPYFLIIEEINRGNCAQIFGDLFQLLDRNNAGSSSYAIHADEDISQFLSGDNKGFASLSDDQKDAIRSFSLEKDNGKTQAVGQDILDGKLLLLPPNLYIWATMNTSDQSLFPIDSAFKRRWNWKYMPIEYSPLDKKTQQPIDWKFKIGDNLYSWGQFLSKINPEIYTLTESSDKQMGYFFAKPDNATGIISEDVFLNKVLFYLWTDVFKDFDVSSELFKNKKANRSFRFTDFFEDSEALGNFIDNLGLDVVDIDIDTVEDEDSPEDPSTSSNPGQRDRSKYSINGEGKNNKRQTVLRSLRKFVENNPELTADEVIAKWKGVNPDIPFFILTTTEFENRISEMPGQRNRYWSVTVGNGEKVYITNQWGAGRMSGFVDLINNSDLGIHIEKVSE
ncbi:MAG: AAA family ATPase [Muribaculaceae bacterium]|nr:AAA family ATPase [Muribaculaceae bacterium]